MIDYHDINDMLAHFTYEHLPEHLQERSKQFYDLAIALAKQDVPNRQLLTCLSDLLRAKDAAVRSRLHENKRRSLSVNPISERLMEQVLNNPGHASVVVGSPTVTVPSSGLGIVSVSLPAVADAPEVVSGPLKLIRERCGGLNREFQYVCSRYAGHQGPHVNDVTVDEAGEHWDSDGWQWWDDRGEGQ